MAIVCPCAIEFESLTHCTFSEILSLPELGLIQFYWGMISETLPFLGIIFFMHPTNGKQYYIVTSLIGWGHAQNDPEVAILRYS